MRVLISADMEGATGVTFPDDCEPGSPRWEYYRVLFAGDLNAAIGGFFDAGADEVLIGRHKPQTMMEGIDQGFDTVALPTMREAIRCFRALTQIASGSIEKTYG